MVLPLPVESWHANPACIVPREVTSVGGLHANQKALAKSLDVLSQTLLQGVKYSEGIA
jgi:hypothetical protein